MGTRRRYTGEDVLAAAVARIQHIYDTFDHVAVCFSGGKDSLVLLHLAREAAEQNDALPVVVVFRDEELIPDSVIDKVNEYRQLDWIDLHWFCVPLSSQKFILGKSFFYVQWDPDRPWVREQPPWAILPTEEDVAQGLVLDQYTGDGYFARRLGFRGRTCFMTGVRTSESLMRYQSIMNKLVEPFVSSTKANNVKLGKPIYDWAENDILRYVWDHKDSDDCELAGLYRAQHLNGTALRVSTPIHAEKAKRLDHWRRLDPEFYDRVLEVFPEMRVQDRYWSQLDLSHLKELYGQDLRGVRDYIIDRITDVDQRRLALGRLRSITVARDAQPECYPARYVLGYFMGGSFKRNLLPMAPKHKKKRSVSLQSSARSNDLGHHDS